MNVEKDYNENTVVDSVTDRSVTAVTHVSSAFLYNLFSLGLVVTRIQKHTPPLHQVCIDQGLKIHGRSRGVSPTILEIVMTTER